MAEKFPWRKKDSSTLDDGKQVARARYQHGLRETAQDILKEASEPREPDEDRVIDEDEMYERVNQAADDAVIYTRDALEIMQVSDNWLAFDDEGMELGAGEDITASLTQWAYFAYRADLNRMVEAYRGEYED